VQRILNQGKSRSIFKDTEIGLGKWRQQVMMFGMGQDLAIDLPNIKSGNIPSVEYYDKIYGRGRWAYSTIYSISIGQGEMEVIPLQMANLAAIIANGGHYYTPHIVQRVGENGDKLPEYRVRHSSGISAEHFPPVREAMRRVVYEPGGTARRARLDSIIVCGKTGTAQNPHGEDHSVFIAFAPMDNPTIAIAVYVENAGGGGTWAAPISSLMIDQYISDSISKPKREQRILDANFIDPPK
jgi:penicillin-binding protein 2